MIIKKNLHCDSITALKFYEKGEKEEAKKPARKKATKKAAAEEAVAE